MWLLLLKYDDRHEHSDDDLAVCEADGEDDMLGPLSPHASWRWNPVDEVDVSAQGAFGLRYQRESKDLLRIYKC